MKRRNQGILNGLLLLLPLALLAACASIPELKVLYRLSSEERSLVGRELGLVVEDGRQDRQILGVGARRMYEGFPGNITLSVASPGQEGFMVGIFSPSAALQEAFSRKMKALGIQILSGEPKDRPQIVLDLKQFHLDLLDRNWTGKIQYEARLLHAGRLVATRFVTAEGERWRTMGRGQAEDLMGELFTDAVNQLDLGGFLQTYLP